MFLFSTTSTVQSVWDVETVASALCFFFFLFLTPCGFNVRMWPEGVSQCNRVRREESFNKDTCQQNSLQSASPRSSSRSPPRRRDTTPAAARRHHSAVHYYPSLPFFPMTPLDFNHLLISPVVWGEASRTEFKLPRSEDRSVTFSYEKEYGMCAVHPISQHWLARRGQA